VNVPFAPIPTAAQLSALAPARAPAGTVVTITGSNFSGVVEVNIGGEALTDFAVLSVMQLQIAVPEGLTGSVPVAVRNPAGYSNTLTFTYK